MGLKMNIVNGKYIWGGRKDKNDNFNLVCYMEAMWFNLGLADPDCDCTEGDINRFLRRLGRK